MAERGYDVVVAEAETPLSQHATARDMPVHGVRLAVLVEEHFPYVWRVLRRLGLPPADADDVAQVVFVTVSRRVGDIDPGAERSFLYKTAIHFAYKHRRTQQRRREDFLNGLEVENRLEDAPDDLLDRRRARDMLDAILASMPVEFRVVFVLYELEGLTTPEIAEVVGIPIGTAASRLRRARADFELRVGRLEARRKPKGGRLV